MSYSDKPTFIQLTPLGGIKSWYVVLFSKRICDYLFLSYGGEWHLSRDIGSQTQNLASLFCPLSHTIQWDSCIIQELNHSIIRHWDAQGAVQSQKNISNFLLLFNFHSSLKNWKKCSNVKYIISLLQKIRKHVKYSHFVVYTKFRKLRNIFV